MMIVYWLEKNRGAIRVDAADPEAPGYQGQYYGHHKAGITKISEYLMIARQNVSARTSIGSTKPR